MSINLQQKYDYVVVINISFNYNRLMEFTEKFRQGEVQQGIIISTHMTDLNKKRIGTTIIPHRILNYTPESLIQYPTNSQLKGDLDYIWYPASPEYDRDPDHDQEFYLVGDLIGSFPNLGDAIVFKNIDQKSVIKQLTNYSYQDYFGSEGFYGLREKRYIIVERDDKVYNVLTLSVASEPVNVIF